MRYLLMMLAGAGLLSLTACKKEAIPEQPQVSNDIIPLKIGNKWTYQYEQVPEQAQRPDQPFTRTKFEVKKRITKADFWYPEQTNLDIVDKYDWYFVDRDFLGGIVLCNAAPNLVLILRDFPLSTQVDTFIYDTDKDEEILRTEENSYVKYIKVAYGKTVDVNGYSSKHYANLVLTKPGGHETRNTIHRYYQRGLGLTMLSTILGNNGPDNSSERFRLVSHELK